MTAIKKVLAEKYESQSVYIQACPLDFARPSFLIELVKVNRTDVDRNTIEKIAYYTITYFVEVDNQYTQNMESLLDLQDDVLQLFSAGYVTVGDRAIKLKSSSGGTDSDRAYIDLQFEYFDNRTDAVEEFPLAATVNTELGGIE